MEDVDTTTKNVKNGFINHVFNFDNDISPSSLFLHSKGVEIPSFKNYYMYLSD